MPPAAEYPTRGSGSCSQWLHPISHLRSIFDDPEAFPSCDDWACWVRVGCTGQRLQWRVDLDEVCDRHNDSFQDSRHSDDPKSRNQEKDEIILPLVVEHHHTRCCLLANGLPIRARCLHSRLSSRRGSAEIFRSNVDLLHVVLHSS
jgi:hypothetical protein